MISIKAIIVDDEPAARSLLRKIINEHCPAVEIIDEAPDVKTAVKLINKHKVAK